MTINTPRQRAKKGAQRNKFNQNRKLTEADIKAVEREIDRYWRAL